MILKIEFSCSKLITERGKNKKNNSYLPYLLGCKFDLWPFSLMLPTYTPFI